LITFLPDPCIVSNVELGALEPLLWQEGPLRAPDLVRALTDTGVAVSMTTNGSRLQPFAPALKAAGLTRLRISWHTTDSALFQEISGGGRYDVFQAGIKEAAQVGLDISFNRVLLRGATADLPAQLDFIEEHGCGLKLYDLLWTPDLEDRYQGLYLDWRGVVRRYVLPRTLRMERIGSGITRGRLRFHLSNRSFVEVKLGDSLDRSNRPCQDCTFVATCREQFGDYVRVEPELDAYFCYLRRDLSFNLRSFFNSDSGATELRERLSLATGLDPSLVLRDATLRFIAVPFCNFNCFVPGTAVSWCHKTSGNYRFPERRSFKRSLLAIGG
jgi:cyclic pyranopterin phosphate synthase